jgi:hypothetical protein
MRRIALALACLTALLLSACAGGGSDDSIRTYSQKDAGNIAASDSLGSGLWQHTGVQTAFVPEE